MTTHTFKIQVKKFVNETDKEYIFASSKKCMKNVFSIPKNQILKFEKKNILNNYTNKNNLWIEITVTDWIWIRVNLEKKLSRWKSFSTVVIENETHFGINWDYVISKRRNLKNCFFCHNTLNKKTKTVDHLIPRIILKAYGYKKGLPNNTVPSCPECNQEKASLHPEVYRELVKRKISETGSPKYRIIMFTLNQILKIN